jgi:hypothetical protein
MTGHDDFAFEPVPGLPAKLPEGEVLLWQGSPDWRSFALEAFHIRKLAVYFGLLLAWLTVTAWYDARPARETTLVLSSSALASLAALGLVAGLAWGYARSTIYSLTSRRLIIRHGLAMPMAVNVPFNQVDAAFLTRNGRSGTGTVCLQLKQGSRLAWLSLWPSQRPWHFRLPQPSMRCIPEPEKAASLLSDAMVAAEGDAIKRSNLSVPVRPAKASGTLVTKTA